jgi:hypothetical protein
MTLIVELSTSVYDYLHSTQHLMTVSSHGDCTARRDLCRTKSAFDKFSEGSKGNQCEIPM